MDGGNAERRMKMFGLFALSSHIGTGDEVPAPAIRKQIKNGGKEDITESETELTKNGELPFEDIKNN